MEGGAKPWRFREMLGLSAEPTKERLAGTSPREKGWGVETQGPRGTNHCVVKIKTHGTGRKPY